MKFTQKRGKRAKRAKRGKKGAGFFRKLKNQLFYGENESPRLVPPFVNWTQTYYEGEHDGKYSLKHRGQPKRHKKYEVSDYLDLGKKGRHFLVQTNKLRDQKNIDPSRKYLSPADVKIISDLREERESKKEFENKVIQLGKEAILKYGNTNSSYLGKSPIYSQTKTQQKYKKGGLRTKKSHH